MTISSKQVYNYTAVKDVIFHKVQKYYGYEVAITFRDVEESDIEGEIPTRIMILEMDPGTKDTNQIGLYMLYKSYITDYIKRIL